MTNNKSISKNYFYNTLLKVLNIIFPMITFPYIARVLSASGVGKVHFSLSVIAYFILISRVGIPMYGIRECAKYKDNKNKLSKAVQEILLINLISLILSMFVFYLLVFYSGRLSSYKNILLILSINVISTSLGIEWFYQAIEEYKYITIRNIIVKLLSLILIFLFINDKSDVNIYAIILVISLTGGYLYNFFHAQVYVNLFKKYSSYNIKRHLKPILMLFAMSISISIYVNLDKVMLGLLTNDTAVGYYTAANKMIKVIVALITSLSTVLLPRMSYYIENNLTKKIDNLINKSLNFILIIALPAVVGVFMLAKQIILIFTGTGYTEAILTIKLLAPLILVIGLSNLLGVQILISHGKERLTLISTVIGALINFILNLILIPKYQHNGAAVATLIAEVAVASTQVYFAYSYLKGKINYKSLIDYCIGTFLIILTCISINYLINNIIVVTILSVGLSSLVYFGYLHIKQNSFMLEIEEKIIEKINRGKYE